MRIAMLAHTLIAAILAVTLASCGAAPAFAQTTVSNLPTGAPISAADNMYAEQGACPASPPACNGVKVTGAMVKTWAQSGIQAPLIGPYISGFWHVPPFAGPAGAGAALSIGSIHCVAFIQPSAEKIQGLGLRIATVSAGGNVQAAIYANNPLTGRPTGVPLAATTSLSTTTAGVVTSAVTPATIPAGYDWMCVNADNAVVVVTPPSPSATDLTAGIIGSATAANVLSAATTAALFVSTPQTFGTWPTLTGATWTEVAGSNALGLVMWEEQ